MAYHSSAEQFRFGFRVLGDCTEPRRLVDHRKAFVACCEADPRSEPDRESYLSAFQFRSDFADYLERTGSTRDFAGPCWADLVWFDIDREGDLKAAHGDTLRLVVALTKRLKIAEHEVAVFFSGGKGFHVGVPIEATGPKPSDDFNRIARRFCETIAEQAEVVIDTAVYDKVRCFRAPNSRHPKTGLYKRYFYFHDLITLPTDAVVKLAAEPNPLDIIYCPIKSESAATLWAECADRVRRETETHAARRANAKGDDKAKLNRQTLACISEGVPSPRHKTLFSASANLAEFGAPLGLCRALLEEGALDSGLTPQDAKRTICCGWASVQPTVKPICEAVGGMVFDVQAVTPADSPKAAPTTDAAPATATTAEPDAEPKAVPNE